MTKQYYELFDGVNCGGTLEREKQTDSVFMILPSAPVCEYDAEPIDGYSACFFSSRSIALTKCCIR